MCVDHIFKPHIFITELALQLPDPPSKLHLYQVKLFSENKRTNNGTVYVPT